MSPRLYNFKNGDAPADAVNIMRPGPYGNPFRGPSRVRNVHLHKEWLLSQPRLIARVKRELRGKDLFCGCAPKKCHGEILLAVANSR